MIKIIIYLFSQKKKKIEFEFSRQNYVLKNDILLFEKLN